MKLTQRQFSEFLQKLREAILVAQQQMDFIEAFSAPVQDELDRRRSRLIDRRFTLSGLCERKDLKDFDWHYHPKNPKREILELATLKFIDEREDALFIGSPGAVNISAL
jgi:hypothetical protein